MPRRPTPAPVWALLCLLTVALSAAPAPAGAQTAPPPGSAPAAKAWLLADADTGAVLDAFNEHQALPPASTQKIMTALVAAEKLPRDARINVGPLAAAQPAMKIGMTEGQQWDLRDSLHSLMMVSANDAAYALAETASGSLEAFAADMNVAAARYGMADSRFSDPAGFDGTEGFEGGSRVSAYDLAIAARNYLAVPELRAIVGLAEYRFDGPARPHVLRNHNKLLARYPGATGLKTGYTSLAGNTFVGTATRDGRTMIAVVLNSTNMYGLAASLLDKGFATPAEAAGIGAPLPAVRVQAFPVPAALVAGKAVADQTPVGGGRGARALTTLFLVVGGTGATVVALRRRAERRRRERAERRRRMAAMRRAAYLDALTDDSWDIEMAVPVQGQFEALAPLPVSE
jgi:serine-type D-Ala-D-Ala carboxypeptidase (penicillin-binding protein 5/6)